MDNSYIPIQGHAHISLCFLLNTVFSFHPVKKQHKANIWNVNTDQKAPLPIRIHVKLLQISEKQTNQLLHKRSAQVLHQNDVKMPFFATITDFSKHQYQELYVNRDRNLYRIRLYTWKDVKIFNSCQFQSLARIWRN